MTARLIHELYEVPLTKREIQVLRYIACGHPDEEIADIMGVSKHTIHSHAWSLRMKLGARNRPHAIHIMHTSKKEVQWM